MRAKVRFGFKVQYPTCDNFYFFFCCTLTRLDQWFSLAIASDVCVCLLSLSMQHLIHVVNNKIPPALFHQCRTDFDMVVGRQLSPILLPYHLKFFFGCTIFRLC
jgi:hypothetical protein